MLEEQRSLQERQQAQLDCILAAVGGSTVVCEEDCSVTFGPAKASQHRAVVATAIQARAVPHALLDCRAGMEEWLLPATLHSIQQVPTAPSVSMEPKSRSPASVPGQDGLH